MNETLCKTENEKSIFMLSLPEGSICISLLALDKLVICAAFDVPERGIEIYILNPNTGKTIKVEGIL
jgi:hypothetical protein